MDSAARREHWETVYETKDATSVSWYEPEATTSLALIQSVTTRRSEAVIDVGGGASRLVDGLLAAGYTDVSVLDISATALDVARKRLGPDAAHVRWIATDLLTWVPDRQFDTWHDRAVLHFLTDAADQVAYARLLGAAVRSGGHAVIGTFAPDGPTKCSGLPVQRHDAHSLVELVGSGFDLVAEQRETHTTPAGANQAFRWSVLRRH